MIQPIKKLIILSLILFASMSWAEDTLLSIPFDGKKLELNYKRGAKKQSGNQTLGVTLEPANMDEMEQTEPSVNIDSNLYNKNIIIYNKNIIKFLILKR